MNIKAKDVVVGDRIEMPGRGVCVVTHVIKRDYPGFTPCYEILFGARLTSYCDPEFTLIIAEPDQRIVPSDSVKVDYPQCPRYQYRPPRKSYDWRLGGLPRE